MGKIAGSNLSKVKQQNTRYIREVIYRRGPISRSEIAEILSLTPPTITTNVAEMIAAGYLQELPGNGGREEGTLGRKPVDIDFLPDAYFFIGIEITPFEVLACLTNLRGQVLAHMQQPNTNPDYRHLIELIARQVNSLIKQADIPASRLLGMGVGVPGFVKSKEGVVLNFRRFQWENMPLAADLHKRTGLRTHIDNNVRMRAVGENLTNKSTRPESFAYFYVGYGIACPMVIQNSIFSEQTAGAGEVGHMVVEIDGAKCATCGNFGCLEAYSSDTAVVQQCAEAIREGHTMLAELAKNPASPTMEEILEAAACSDRVVNSILRGAVRYLAVALANIINFISPRLVIVDAKLMKLPRNRDYFMSQLKQNLYGLDDNEITVEFQARDKLGGAKGAAAAAILEFFIKER